MEARQLREQGSDRIVRERYWRRVCFGAGIHLGVIAGSTSLAKQQELVCGHAILRATLRATAC